MGSGAQNGCLESISYTAFHGYFVSRRHFLTHNTIRPLPFERLKILFKYILYFIFFSGANRHLFVGNPPPFRAQQDITLLIMTLNGDLNVGIGQQPFPRKGYYADIDGPGRGARCKVERRSERNVFVCSNQQNLCKVLANFWRIFDSTNATGATMHNPGAGHSGGSCQVAFSYDKGNTWVVHSWEGNCLRVSSPGIITNLYDLNQD